MSSVSSILQVPLRDIPPEGLSRSGSVSALDLGLEQEGVICCKPVDFFLNLRPVGSLILIKGEVRTQIKQQCSRCLKEIEVPIREDKVFASPEASSFLNTIDLTGILRDYIFLALPGKPVCTPECRGLCPRCGIDLNVETCDCSRDAADSPFSALSGLIQEEKKSSSDPRDNS